MDDPDDPDGADDGSESGAYGDAAAEQGRPGRDLAAGLTIGARWSLRLLLVAAALALLIWLASQLKLVLIPVAIAVLLARGLKPPADWLRAHGWSPSLATVTSLGVFLLVAGGIGAFVVSSTAPQFADLGPTLEDAVDDVEDWLVDDAPVELSREQVRDGRELIGERLSSLRERSNGSLTDTAGLVVESITAAAIVAFLTFFLVRDGHLFARWLRGFVPPVRRELADDMGRRSWSALGAYLRGAALLGAFDATAIGVAMALVGGELVLSIALVTFLAAFVPILGAIVAGVLAVLVTLVTAGVQQAVILAVVAVAVQQLNGNVLEPVIYGKALTIHPAVILLAVVAGGALFGIVGTFFAVPATAVVMSALSALSSEDHDALGTAPRVAPTDAV